MAIDFDTLAEPFAPWDVEWRVSRAGKKNANIWARVLAYITNRAIMERLDTVVGPENWKNDYREGPGGGVLAGIGIRIDGEWVWKWDGAENTEIESVKGGLSGSMKRAAVQWGIGRYLYKLDEGFAEVHRKGRYYGRLPKDKGGDSFHWDPPDLPEWALPDGVIEGRRPPVDREADEAGEDEGEGAQTDEETLKLITDWLDELREVNEDRADKALKHYENQLDTITSSKTAAHDFLGLVQGAVKEEKEKAKESTNERVPA